MSNVVAITTKSDIMSAMLIHAIANIRADGVAYDPNSDIDNILVGVIINHLTALMILTWEMADCIDGLCLTQLLSATSVSFIRISYIIDFSDSLSFFQDGREVCTSVPSSI